MQAMELPARDYTIRTMAASEIPFLRNSLFLSARDANAAHRRLSNREYARSMSGMTDDLLASFPDIVVADSDGLVLGYAVGLPVEDAYCIAYVYVKSHSRRNGLAKELVAALLDRAGDLEPVGGIFVDRWAPKCERVVSRYIDLDAAVAR